MHKDNIKLRIRTNDKSRLRHPHGLELYAGPTCRCGGGQDFDWCSLHFKSQTELAKH